ncbi:hypothetical protein LLH03_10805 [bacterium]|nr:hypothetical protein [bacterium]
MRITRGRQKECEALGRNLLSKVGVSDTGRLTDDSAAVLFTGAAEQLAIEGAVVPLLAWECKVLRWEP